MESCLIDLFVPVFLILNDLNQLRWFHKFCFLEYPKEKNPEDLSRDFLQATEWFQYSQSISGTFSSKIPPLHEYCEVGRHLVARLLEIFLVAASHR